MPNNTPETGVTFFRSGGHTHDGVNSSPIATSNYSIFDFGVDVTTNNQDRARELNRDNNRNRFNQYISSFISTQVLAPAGIELAENSVRGIHIGAREISTDKIGLNTITANNLANVITIDTQIVQSGNYVANTSGWLLSSNGFAEFGNVKVRGEVNATSGSFSGSITSNATITGGTISGGTISGGTISGGEININSGTFRVYSNGAMSASAATISGSVTASSGTIGGWTINSNSISGGNTTLYSNGYISAVSSNFTTPTIGTPSITGGTGSNVAITNGTSAFNANGYISSVSGLLSNFTLGSNTFTQGNVTLSGAISVYQTSGGYVNGTLISGNSIIFKYSSSTAATMRGFSSIYGSQLTIDTTAFVLDNCNTVSITPVTSGGVVDIYLNPTSTTSSGNEVRYIAGRLYKFTSRREFKNNITDIVDGLSLIKQLKPVSFTERYNLNVNEIEKFLKSNKINYGFIVEDVESVDRNLVAYDYAGDPTNVDWDDTSAFYPTVYDSNGIISMLTKAVQQLSDKIDALEAKLGD